MFGRTMTPRNNPKARHRRNPRKESKGKKPGQHSYPSIRGRPVNLGLLDYHEKIEWLVGKDNTSEALSLIEQNFIAVRIQAGNYIRINQMKLCFLDRKTGLWLNTCVTTRDAVPKVESYFMNFFRNPSYETLFTRSYHDSRRDKRVLPRIKSAFSEEALVLFNKEKANSQNLLAYSNRDGWLSFNSTKKQRLQRVSRVKWGRLNEPSLELAGV